MKQSAAAKNVATATRPGLEYMSTKFNSGAGLRSETLWPACERLVQEIQLAFEQVLSGRDGVAEFKIRLDFCGVRRPYRQALAVGIAGGNEVDPVRRHRVGEFAIDVSIGKARFPRV